MIALYDIVSWKQYNIICVYFINLCVFSKLALHHELKFSEEDIHCKTIIACVISVRFDVQFSVNCQLIVSNLMCQPKP